MRLFFFTHLAYFLFLCVVFDMGEFVNVEAPCRGVDDILVYAALAIEAVGIAALLHTTVAEGIDDVRVYDLRDGVGDEDDGAALLYGIKGCFYLLGGDSVK